MCSISSIPPVHVVAPALQKRVTYSSLWGAHASDPKGKIYEERRTILLRWGFSIGSRHSEIADAR